MKRIVINTERLNSYGFWVKTDGIDLTDFANNPIMLYNHNRSDSGKTTDQLPIGCWRDVRVENGVLSGEPVFDMEDEFAAKIARKYESGVLNACSMGIRCIEWSEAPELMKEGQTGPTVTRCRLLEVSICDIPSNPDATVVMYDESDNIINLSDIGRKLTTQTMNKEIALKLGLDEKAETKDCIAAIEERDSRIADLSAKLEKADAELKTVAEAKAKQLKDEAASLVDEAIRTGKIDASQREAMLSLFGMDFDNAKSVVASLSGRTPLAAQVANSATELEKLSWDELDKSDRLAELKEKHPELFARKFEEKFGTKLNAKQRFNNL